MKMFVLLLYVLLALVVGYLNRNSSQSTNSFFLGDRAIGPWMSAFAYGTTYFSAVLFIGYAGKTGWEFGLSSLWIVAGNAFLGSYLAWKVLASRTRAMTARLDTVTLPEYLAARYDSKWLKPAAAGIIFVFLVPYSASVYKGLSHLFDAAFPIASYQTALVAMAILTAVYLIMGGYKAVVTIDFIQGSIMLVGALLLVGSIVANPEVGGILQVVDRLKEVNPRLAAPVGPPGFVELASLVCLTSLGTWGLPQMVQKFYSVKDERAASRATTVATVFALVVAFGAYFSGSLSRLFFEEMPGGNPDMVMPALVSTYLPDYLMAVILMLVLSASMSTLASLVLVASSALAIDLGEGRLWPAHRKDTTVWVMRVLCLVFVLLSLYFALTDTPILAMMSFSWGTLAGAFLAPYVYGLFWRRGTREAAWISLLTGLLISVIWASISGLDASRSPLIGSVSMIVPLVVYPVVSFLTPALPVEHVEKCFGREVVTDWREGSRLEGADAR